MDSLINAAARLLSAGDPLAALNRVALRDDPDALALRGIALAQLGDLATGRELLARAAVGFSPDRPVARARCIVASAEVALASRELGFAASDLETASETLSARGDRFNAVYGRLLLVRRSLILGDIDGAGTALEALDTAGAPAALRAVAHLVAAHIEVRRVRIGAAEAAFDSARDAAADAGVRALVAEVNRARAVLDAAAGRLAGDDGDRPVTLRDIPAVLNQGRLVIDGCRRAVRHGDRIVSLVRRPVLFALARELALAGAAGATRDALVARVFAARATNESLRARLRVETSRLRKVVAGLATVAATATGFALRPVGGEPAVVLLPPVDGNNPAIMALLADGEAWSSSALALALGSSQRTVQRALAELEADGRVRHHGDGPRRRWTTRSTEVIATALLLPQTVPGR